MYDKLQLLKYRIQFFRLFCKKLNYNCCIMEYAYKENDRYSNTFST